MLSSADLPSANDGRRVQIVLRLSMGWLPGADRMGRRRRARLYQAVLQLPPQIKCAMLQAIDEQQELIVGAYVDRRGRSCPMLAAHRRGARIAVGAFPRAWDQFGQARRPRLATPRELEVLRAMLEEGIASDVAAGAPRSEVGRLQLVAPT